MFAVRLLFLGAVAVAGGINGGCDSEGGDPPSSGDENVGGVVYDDQGPVAGATVSVFGASPAVEITTDDAGRFALEAPLGTPDLLVEVDGYWGALTRVHLEADEIIDDLELDVVADATVAEVAQTLGRTIDEANGVLLVDFYAAGAPLGGEHAELDVAADAPFTFDETGTPVESETLLEGDGEAELVFTNVGVGDLDLIVFGDDVQTGCAPEFDSALDGRWPVAAGVFTRVRAFCGPI